MMSLVIKKFKELTLEELYEILKVRVGVFVVEQNAHIKKLMRKINKVCICILGIQRAFKPICAYCQRVYLTKKFQSVG